MSGEPQPDARARYAAEIISQIQSDMQPSALFMPASQSLGWLKIASLSTLTTYDEWHAQFKRFLEDYLADRDAGRPTDVSENALHYAFAKMRELEQAERLPTGKAMRDIGILTRQQGARRRRHTRRRHTRRRHTRRRRGGGPQIFRDIAKKGDEVSTLVDKINTFTSKGDGAGALPAAITLVNLVGYDETERLLKNIPPPELKKILAGIR